MLYITVFVPRIHNITQSVTNNMTALQTITVATYIAALVTVVLAVLDLLPV